MAPETPNTLNQDLLAVIKATAAGLSSAYAKMTHPLLVEKERDEFYFGMMGKIGAFRKEVEARVKQEEADGPQDGFRQLLKSTDYFISDIFTLRTIGTTAIEATQRIASKNVAILEEETVLSALDATLRERFYAKSKGDPVPPMLGKDEIKLEQLEAQYGDRVGESKFFQHIEEQVAADVRAGKSGAAEEFTMRGAELREIALVDVAEDGCNDARKQMLSALQEITAVQKSIKDIMARYDMEVEGRARTGVGPSTCP